MVEIITACIDELVSYARRIWEMSLNDISRDPLPELLDDFRKIRNDFKKFQIECYGKVDSNIYNYYESVFNISLLKLSVAIEDKVKDKEISDEYIKFTISMFTPDEKNVIREFEKFSGLDPSVTPPEALAEVIVSGKGEIYSLVKEAVSKQYIDFANIIKSWSGRYNIGDSVRRGLILRYEVRFKNVVEAIKKLIDNQPAWLKRLFSEYEDALLSSAEVRSEFEKRFKEVYDKEVKLLRERIDSLEREKDNLMNRLSALMEKATSKEVEVRMMEEELSRVRREYENLKSMYMETLKGWEGKVKELEELKNKLSEKEKELEVMSSKEKEATAAKEALESEILRLKSIIQDYEAKLKDYEKAKEDLLLELKSMEDKVNTFEKSIRGEIKGHLIRADEAAMLELIFIEKLRGRLRDLPIIINTPWGDVNISKWGSEEVLYEEEIHEAILPKNSSIIFRYRSKRFLGLGEEKVVEVRGIYLSHIDVLRKKGFDSQPASLSDLLKVLKKVTEEGGSAKKFLMIGVASPTGWEEDVMKYVSGKNFTLVFGDVVVILIDLLENRAIYPEELASVMPSIDRYARLFLPEIRVEEEASIEKAIVELCDTAKAKSPIEPIFLYDELMKKVKGTSNISLLRVLHRYRKKDYLELKDVDGRKVVVCKS
jgi:predicted  nucleic acid-binding Zn-ribbon protein